MVRRRSHLALAAQAGFLARFAFHTFLAIGPIAKGVVTVAYTEPKEDVIRIIRARMATRGEEETFYLKAGGPKR